jgi:hypothetical protein
MFFIYSAGNFESLGMIGDGNVFVPRPAATRAISSTDPLHC